ncbi:hypothetical protein [Microlunatus flavus]|uniref:Uncharacterized protein n=1 Tax=Microlunatus flavus TaxID=1036181 RepID=A0A1H9KYK2_9ACTN|nr:hypothetical protein [Microlunatus flavus]SER03985.1 hypothetical protein SAMN05421756_10867 [Microlunatus flavus]
MTSGETSPWGPGPSSGPGPAYPAPYGSPWPPGPAGPASYQPVPSWGPAPGVTDEQLRQLPPPVPSLPLAAGGEQRPAVVGLAVTLAVTAAMLWVCGLSLFLLVAAAGTRALGPSGDDGVIFHLLDEAVLRMGDGLWLPLYGFPVASVVTAFCLLARRPWTRIAHTAVGVVALAWAAWWLRESWLTWFVVAVYVGTAVGVLWVPSANRWYGRRDRRARAEGFRLEG